MLPQAPAGIVIHHTGVKAKPNTPIGRKMRGLQEFSQTKQNLATGKTIALAAYVAKKYGFTGGFTWFHSEKAHTACPGKYLIAALEGSLTGRLKK